MILRGERVVLRYPKVEDARILLKEVCRPEISKNIQVHWKRPTLNGEKKWIKEVLKKNRKKEGLTFVVLDRRNKEIIGTCGFNKIFLKDGYGYAGWWLKRKCWGKGYFLDFAKLLLDYGFRKLKLNKVEGQVFGYNIRSDKSIRKLGFKLEGVIRKRWRKGGKYFDEYRFGILKQEWEKIRKRI